MSVSSKRRSVTESLSGGSARAKSGKAEAEASFFNASREKVCYCLLTGRLPQSHERILLAQMIIEGDPTNKLS
jgi:hypothetical protein